MPSESILEQAKLGQLRIISLFLKLPKLPKLPKLLKFPNLTGNKKDTREEKQRKVENRANGAP